MDLFECLNPVASKTVPKTLWSMEPRTGALCRSCIEAHVWNRIKIIGGPYISVRTVLRCPEAEASPLPAPRGAGMN
ncbi:MAG TPA: hypothetical protein VMV49_17735 [Candidatus Deferrimicrobium sp.]|nr:hypothetical protein [Candidatus Deferrimicrobium sp.]